jgi:dienelactone hydrolase
MTDSAEARSDVDERIQVAVQNWAPRFVANGVDINDLQRITSNLTLWADWCSAWSQAGKEHAQLAEEAESERFYRSAAQHYFQAAMLYHFGKFMFFQYPDQYRTTHEEVVGLYQRGMRWHDYPGERVEIPFEKGSRIYGILRKPWHHANPSVVIISPGLDSVKEEMHCYGDDFLRRGMAVLAIDGPGQGELEFEFRMRHDYEVPLRYVVDYLETRPDVDSERIGLMGVSVGGYNAMRGAAFEPRIRAAIALAVGYRLIDYFDRVPILTREALVHKLKARDEQAARQMLQAWDLHDAVRQIGCPVLVIMGRLDRLFPAEDTEQMVSDAGPNVELLMFEDGNHVCNNIAYKYRPKQADWMSRRLHEI